jgi:hypothetical protein
MPSNLKYSTELRNDRLASIISRLGANPTITLYDGLQPDRPNIAVGSQTPLANLAASASLANTPTGGVLTANAIAPGTGLAGATASGKSATWGRMFSAAGVGVVDFSVGATGSDLNMTPDPLIKTGQTVLIDSIVINAGN